MKTLICELKKATESFLLKYLLFVENNEPDAHPQTFFSIRILLLRKDSSEYADACNITACSEEAQNLLAGLHRCTVTPIGLPQVMEDYFGLVTPFACGTSSQPTTQKTEPQNRPIQVC